MNENVIDAFEPPGADLAQDVFVRMPTGEIVPFSKIRRSKMTVTRGGAGSGHRGHKGRPGKVGGSLPSQGDIPDLFVREQKRLIEYAQEHWKEVKSLPRLAWMTPDGTMYSIVEAGYMHDEGAALALVFAGAWEQESVDAIHEVGRLWTGQEAQRELMEYDFVRIMTTPKEFAFAFISPQKLTREARDSLAAQVLLAKRRGLDVLGQPYEYGLPNYYNYDDLLDILNISASIERGGPGSGHEGHRGRPGEVGGSLPSGGGVATQEKEITQAPDSGGNGAIPQVLSEYINTYDAVLREGESERDFKVRVYKNALQIALEELEGMTPDEILSLDRNKFNLAQAPFDVLLSGDDPIEGMDDEQKELLRQSYIFSVQSGYDAALLFMHRRLVAGGKVAPDDTRLPYGAKRTRGRGGWETMPEKLYHVTTAADAIKADAIKSRFELGLWSTKGLGGGEDDTISFSADLDVAKEIDRALHEGSAAARGDFTIEQMVRWAAEGVDAPKPYLGFLYALVAGSKSVSDEERAEIDARVAADPTDIPPNVQKVFDTYTNRERDYRNFEFYQSYWANARAHEGGPQYPLFWGVDKKSLADADASQFVILEFSPVEGAMGYQMGGLGEWRTVGGETVELIGEHETLTADEEAEYFAR